MMRNSCRQFGGVGRKIVALSSAILPLVFLFSASQKMKKLLSAIAVLSLLASLPAQAHYLWSENTAKGNLIYFGGVDENVREASPGRVDEFTNLSVKLQSKSGATTERSLKKTHDGFASSPVVTAQESLIGQDLSVSVKDLSAYKLGILKLNFYVRHVQINRAFPAALDLDAVPTGVPNQLKFSFRNTPLSGFKAKLIAPNGWVNEIRTDADGLASISTPWRGNYVVEATYFENVSGEFQGQHYERIRHRLGLTVVQPKGQATFTPDYTTHDHAD